MVPSLTMLSGICGAKFALIECLFFVLGSVVFFPREIVQLSTGCSVRFAKEILPRRTDSRFQ
jgi:hypothetical protein